MYDVTHCATGFAANHNVQSNPQSTVQFLSSCPQFLHADFLFQACCISGITLIFIISISLGNVTLSWEFSEHNLGNSTAPEWRHCLVWQWWRSCGLFWSVSVVFVCFVRGSRRRIRLGRGRDEVVLGRCTRKPLLGLCEHVAVPGSRQRESLPYTPLCDAWTCFGLW